MSQDNRARCPTGPPHDERVLVGGGGHVGVGPPAGSTPFCWVGGSRRAAVWLVLGGVLLSRTLAGAVPSALGVLASGFGMGPGVGSPAVTTETLCGVVCACCVPAARVCVVGWS